MFINSINVFDIFNHVRYLLNNITQFPEEGHVIDRKPEGRSNCHSKAKRVNLERSSVPHPGIQVVFQTAVRWVLHLATLLRTLPLFLLVPTEPRMPLPYCSFRRCRLERLKVPLKRWTITNWSGQDGRHGTSPN
ncbi:hypothetical protein F441_06620 [Phytophthora nicotianae CJ01A1]|uniref:Uncharacterized protein n=5 Tax=Phytophthora nicotianae TaxID=4792 RepID=V9FET7_PHYNI|nr:hypothetical protein F443_06609 [Phytophthora nicotianae P1569]ETK89482.1 hypothetical protein L915_06485 [Phytophthora nicotianae]ETO78311.1 hypothetical protein F444_06681 [Phytophthora nicotianae P1976]ETP19361.1 hypothetical protein F441_06620 [Phytophthora nicotianae CJ01A1]ETP47320.1 hypothetical protein F442_06651 [Phytophthora nicotianae P10297]